MARAPILAFSRLLALSLCGCAGTDAGRLSLVIGTLVEDDQALLLSRPDRVADKYQAMTETAQTFLRGTAGVYYRDVSALRGPFALPHGTDAERVPLYGDLHLENAGATFDDGGVLFDCIDFDSTLDGPFAWDLMRSAVALNTGLDMAGRSAATQTASLDAYTRAYLAALAAPPEVLRTNLGRVVSDTLADGADRNTQREELTKYTVVDGAGRHLLRDVDDVDPPARFAAAIPTALAGYRGRASGLVVEVVDLIQRLNTGIASRANLRFWALVHTDGEDQILELKEERDPPQPVAALGRGAVGGNNADRVLRGSNLLLSTATAEPWLGRLVVAGAAFQVRSVQRGRRDLDVANLVDRFGKGRYDDNDAVALGADLGQLLGRGHASSGHAESILVAAGPTDPLVASVTRFATDYHAQLLTDYALFQHALVERGPLLGAR